MPSRSGLQDSREQRSRAEVFSRPPLSPKNETLYLEACSTPHTSYHAELISEVTRMMEQEEVETSDENLRAVLTSLSCPLCGCNLNKADS